MRKILILAALLGVTSVAHAQTPNSNQAPTDRSLYFSDADLQAILKKQPAGFSTRLFNATTFSTAFIRLAKPDVPHAHGEWSEVFVIKEGSGEITTGGKITGITGTNSATHGDLFTDANGEKRAAAPTPPPAARRSAPGDLAGTGIDGGTVQKVGPGDVILVPAGVAHVFTKVDKPIVYLDIKFPKAN